MKHFPVLLAVFVASAFAAVNVTDVSGPHDLYQGSGNKKLGSYSTHDLCKDAAVTRATTTATVYECRNVAKITVQVVPNPPNPSHGGIPVDPTGWPVPQPGVSTEMLLQTGYIPPPTPPDGAFRTACNFAKMSWDDPIVWPGQPGMAHHHTFFGNTGIDSATTAANIRSKGNATCRGGTINLTGYWIPSMIDTATHKPLAPVSMFVYYKVGLWPYMGDGSIIQPLPPGLKMITGNSNNSDPAQTAAGIACFSNATGENQPGTAGNSIPPSCDPANWLRVRLDFKQCWDGKNLDSPDHKSHMAAPEQHWFGDPERQWRCPLDHPVVLPLITYIIDWKVPANGNISTWRLASDMYDGPGGYSMHADWFNGWDKPISDLWGVECLRGERNCGSANLGDGRVTQEFQGN